MDKQQEQKLIMPSFVLFLVVSGFCTVFRDWLTAKEIDPIVLGFGNLLLFILTLIIFRIQKRALNNTNPNVFVRSVMAGTTIKLFVIALAIVLYVAFAGEQKSLYAIVGIMVLYIIYTVIEVKAILKLNRKDGGN